jgi:hypothetical protein
MKKLFKPEEEDNPDFLLSDATAGVLSIRTSACLWDGEDNEDEL